jgi:hypothetical protein
MKMLNEEIDLRVEEEKKENVEKKDNPVEKKAEPSRPKRCQHEGCKVKLMLADFACRCKSFYCSQHRFAEAHKCSFDYKAVGKDLLTKQMPAVVGEKFERV